MQSWRPVSYLLYREIIKDIKQTHTHTHTHIYIVTHFHSHLLTLTQHILTHGITHTHAYMHTPSVVHCHCHTINLFVTGTWRLLPTAKLLLFTVSRCMNVFVSLRALLLKIQYCGSLGDKHAYNIHSSKPTLLHFRLSLWCICVYKSVVVHRGQFYVLRFW